MTQKEIIKIGRDLILKAGLLNKPTNTQKQQFLKLLDKYELKLQSDSSKYADVVIGFIDDIRDDILHDREINIDSIQDDEYIENYFITKHEVDNFNQLIHEKSFKIIFSELHETTPNKTNIDIAVKDLHTNFQKHFKKINQKNIAKNLLIFTVFDRKLPLPAIQKLIKFMQQHEKLGENIIIIKRIERTYKEFLRQFYATCTDCYKNKKIQHKYLRYRKNDEGELMIELKADDASLYGFRSGNPLYEYKELLVKMA